MTFYVYRKDERNDQTAAIRRVGTSVEKRYSLAWFSCEAQMGQYDISE